MLDQPTVSDSPEPNYPQLTDYATGIINELASRPTVQGLRLPYLGQFEDDDEPYDIIDYPEVRKRLFKNVAKALQSRFPVETDKYILKLENITEQGKSPSLNEEKSALLEGNSINNRFRGTLVLYDKASGKELERKDTTLVNVPYLTRRGTFIRNGSEVGLRHMFQLRPGIYTRIKGDGNVAAHINPKQGTGRQASLDINPETGVFTLGIGTRTYGLLPLLKASGMTPEHIRKLWGDKLFETNYNKYANLMTGKDAKGEAEYTELWNNTLAPALLDERTTKRSLGVPYAKLDGNALLAASGKVLRVSRSMDQSETDSRDGLQFQRILGPADYIPERIIRDGGGLLKNLAKGLDKTGTLATMPSGLFQPHVDAVFQDDKHAVYIDGASPFEAIDSSTGISRLGEGGIGDTRAAPMESRGVHNSYLGYIDPIRSPESLKTGLDVYLAYGVKKDSKGNLYTRMYAKGKKLPTYVDMVTAADSIVTTPEYYDPSADPEEMIPAFIRGGELDYVPRKDVDYFLASSNNMMSLGASNIPNLGGIRSNRTLMGSKYANMAASLVNRETPLVQRELVLPDGTVTTAEKFIGERIGGEVAPFDGTVVSVTDDAVIIRDAEGNRHTIELYNEFPLNQKGWLTSTPKVKAGDTVSKGDVVATNNYTNDKGESAFGTNLRVAFLDGEDGATFEDGIALSETAANHKLKSIQMYKVKAPELKDFEYNKEKHLALFGAGAFTPEQLAKLDDRGFVKPGEILQEGDPIVMGIQQNDPGMRGLNKQASSPFIETWNHHYPGQVVYVTGGRKSINVHIKAETPMQIGDKMCYDDQTSVLTDAGWKLFRDVAYSDKILTMDVDSGDIYFTDYSESYCFDYDDKMYHFKSKEVDLCVSNNHDHVAAYSPEHASLMFREVKSLFKKKYYHFTGMDIFDRAAFKSSKHPSARDRWVDYKGKIYCMEIPETHTMYVMRNNKPVWSGNSSRYGSKGVVRIIPDEEMPIDADGTPIDALQSPLGIPSRVNPAILAEPALGKLARLTGETQVLKDFEQNLTQDTLDKLASYGISPTSTLSYADGRQIKDVTTGDFFVYKLKQMADTKQGARGTADYTSEDIPMKGGKSGSRRMGRMEMLALLGHVGTDSAMVKDIKLIRGQRNDEFWHAVRDGQAPDAPSIPSVHKKFFAHLQAAGVNLEDRGDKVHMFTATDEDVRRLTANRKVQTSATYDAKDLRPQSGGLFDPNIFGTDGDQWGYIELPEPVLNPLMLKPVSDMLGWKVSDLRNVLEGSSEYKGLIGTQGVSQALDEIDAEASFEQAKKILKDPKAPAAKKEQALRKYRALHGLLKEDKQPQDFFLTRIPVLPPKFRPVSIIGNDVSIVSDVNYLYKRMMDNAQDFKEAQHVLPPEEQLDARKALYNSIEAVVGLRDPEDRKLQEKGVQGVLRWAFGKGSPKLGSLQRKVLAATVDTSGMGAIVPNGSLTIDQVGVPENTAWALFEPFVVRKLRQRGLSMSQAMEQVLNRTPEAKAVLVKTMEERPVKFNRAPTLHKYGINALMPVLMEGDAIHMNPDICKVYNADFDGNCCDYDTLVTLFMERTHPYLRLLCKDNDDPRLIRNGQTVVYPGITLVRHEDFIMVVCCIGDMPRPGEPLKDRNGANVYVLPEGIQTASFDVTAGQYCIETVTHLTVEDDCDSVEVSAGCYKAVVSSNESMGVFNPADGTLKKVAPKDCKDSLVPVMRSAYNHQGGKGTFESGWLAGMLFFPVWNSRDMEDRFSFESAKEVKFYSLYKKGVTPRIYPIEASKEYLWGFMSGLIDGGGSVIEVNGGEGIHYNVRVRVDTDEDTQYLGQVCYCLGIRQTKEHKVSKSCSTRVVALATFDIHRNISKLKCEGEWEKKALKRWKKLKITPYEGEVVPVASAEAALLMPILTANRKSSLAFAMRNSSQLERSALLECSGLWSQVEGLQSLYTRTHNMDVLWEQVTSITPAGKRQVFDLMVENTKVFVVNNGMVIYDTGGLHVPVSRASVREAIERMLPSKNLLSPTDMKVHFKPVGEFAKGLFFGTRMKKTPPVKFNSTKEVFDARHRGELDFDSPVDIPELK